ncbi:hypothetical protein KIN20_027876 [Parelaphostrongylus tenuis]|uniref:Uncharacterized protein n=1 Tax=Parelaphostrongylus tenuis TaxID=148309 RepID=A0AAD5R0A5_PARTN|nr:hypothetical protein KIN20_027876 [Parelaphostrongylus tenuis]
MDTFDDILSRICSAELISQDDEVIDDVYLPIERHEPLYCAERRAGWCGKHRHRISRRSSHRLSNGLSICDTQSNIEH